MNMYEIDECTGINEYAWNRQEWICTESMNMHEMKMNRWICMKLANRQKSMNMHEMIRKWWIDRN